MIILHNFEKNNILEKIAYHLKNFLGFQKVYKIVLKFILKYCIIDFMRNNFGKGNSYEKMFIRDKKPDLLDIQKQAINIFYHMGFDFKFYNRNWWKAFCA